MSEAASETRPASPGPATYDQLKSLRGQYALTFFGVLLGALLLSAFIRIATVNGNAQGNQQPISPVMLSIFAMLPCVGVAIVNFIYARKLGMRDYFVAAALGLLPIINWVPFFIIVGFTPQHLKEFEPPEPPRAVATWLIPAFFPILLIGILSVVRPEYMAQLFVGPPLGAFIP